MNTDPLSERQTIEFLYRSYAAADGLWFMKVEERLGFDAALEIDREVWAVVPKIQARLLKSMVQGESNTEILMACVLEKMRIEGFDFTAASDEVGFTVRISRCPWHDLRVKSKREHLSGLIGDVICTTEYAVFASECGGGMSFGKTQGICKGAAECMFTFRRTSPGASD